MKIANILLPLLLTISGAFAQDVTWLPVDSQVNGEPFSLDATSGLYTAGEDIRGYGNQVALDGDSSRTLFFFANQPVFTKPTLAQSDTTATRAAGAGLRLMFRVAEGREIKAVLIVANGREVNSLTYFTPSTFLIRTGAIDPAASASGDVGSAFGMIFVTQAAGASKTKNLIFVTNLHYLDAQPLLGSYPGTFGFRVQGSNGTNGELFAFLNPTYLASVGVSETQAASLVNGYQDGILSATQHIGFTTRDSHTFLDDQNPTNTVFGISLTSSDWTLPRDLSFGYLDNSAPTIKTKKKIRASGSIVELSGTVTDVNQVTRVRITRCASKILCAGKIQNAKVKAKRWSVTVRNIAKGSSFFAVSADDSVGNSSATPVVVQITR